MKRIKFSWMLPFCMMLLCSLIGLQVTTANAAPQYSLDCSSCHQMPPFDSANGKKDPTNGAIPGDHQKHASSTVNSCAKCHGDGVVSYSTSHRNKIIELSDSLGYGRKQAGVFMNQTSVPPSPLATCSTAACHSNGKGVIRETPAWSSTASATCDTCHDSAPSTNSHTKHVSGYSLGCVKCHSDHSAEAKPFQHATSAGRNIDVHFTSAPNSGGTFAANQCSNLYCHSNGQGTAFATPTWGGTADCKACHGDATTDTLSGKHANHVNNATILGTNYGCVACHSETVSNNTTISNISKHADGNKDVPTACTSCHTDGKGTNAAVTWTQVAVLGCDGCHGTSATFGSPAYVSTGGGTAKANSHSKHATSAAACVNCHSKTTTTGTAIIANSQHTDGFINFTSGNGTSFGKQANKNCSNISCHSGNGRVISVQTAQWGATLGCEGCHANANLSGAHTAHVSTRAYGCEQCHSNTASSKTALKAGTTLHMNYSTNITLASGTYNGNLTCSTSSCHGTATPNWKVAASAACGTCHAATSGSTSGLIASNAHTAHYTATYGPGMNGAADTSCAACHTYTGTNSATHPNGTVNLAAGFSANGACVNCHKQTTNWTTGRVSCESCHSTAGGDLSVISGVTAPDKTAAATSGHGKAGIAQGCTACHDNNSAHISGVLGDSKRLLSALGTGNTNCNYCHDNTSTVTNPDKQNMKAHRSSGLGSQCSDCHNSHGTANSMMVNATINGTAISFTGNDSFANGAQTGVCQTCHTTTQYFTKAGITPPGGSHQDSTTNCLECHQHNPAAGNAFTANGACDACHGYPPAPRKLFGGADQVLPAAGWDNAKFENYSGGGGAHLVAAHVAQGLTLTGTDADWTPCLPCHFDGKSNHSKVVPLRSNVQNVTVKIDPQYRFSNDSFIVYTSAKLTSDGANKSGSCFNVSCHLAQTPKWSIER
jgi:predicted CxxxxCH...CXXCH cytochrome family protein